MHVILDARALQEKTEAQEYLQRIFDFPPYYGRNLDALYDCLSEFSDLHIHLLHGEGNSEYYSALLSVFRECGTVNIVH